MNLTTLVGLLLGFGSLIVGFLIEGGTMSALFLLPPAIIVFGGTFGAAAISFNGQQLKRLPSMLAETFKSTVSAELERNANHLEEMATIARAKGILALEEYNNSHADMDQIMKRGVMMVADGVGSERLIESMEAEIEVMEKAKHADISVWEAMGGFSPTMGVLGTVMGLIQTLSHMGSPEELTHSIASAFIATLYGVFIANILFLPVATKLKLNLKFAMLGYDMIVRGIVNIHNGVNPKSIKELTEPYLDAVSKGKKGKGGK